VAAGIAIGMVADMLRSGLAPATPDHFVVKDFSS
jgi:hypothetical protein